ncbi:MAG: hypothetical protein AAF242_20310, partial [Bacteroidota bacterium]
LLLLFTCVLLTSCNPCKSLVAKDNRIQEQFEALKAKGLADTDLKYKAKLKALYLKEKAVLEQVRTCEFEDQTVYNYWYNERLKYPSELEKAWFEMDRERQQTKTRKY